MEKHGHWMIAAAPLTDWKSEFLQETPTIPPHSWWHFWPQLLQHLPPGLHIRHPYASPSDRFHSLHMLHVTSWLWSWGQGHDVNISVFPTASSKFSCLWSVLNKTLHVDKTIKAFWKSPCMCMICTWKEAMVKVTVAEYLAGAHCHANFFTHWFNPFPGQPRQVRIISS